MLWCIMYYCDTLLLQCQYLHTPFSPTDPLPKTPKSDKEGRADAVLSQIPEEDPDDDDDQTQFTESSAPILTTSQYSRFVRSLIKLLVGETTINDWIRKGNT